MNNLAETPPVQHRPPPSPSSQSFPSTPHRPPPPPPPPPLESPFAETYQPAVNQISGNSLNEAKGPVLEFRFVLPAAAIEYHKGAWLSSANLPQLQAFDPSIPGWLADVCGGWFRIRVATRLPKQQAPIGVHRLEYACELPLLPARLVVSLDTAADDGDCKELNALRFKPDTLLKRTCIRVGDDGHEIGGLATVYCHVAVQTERIGIVGIFFWPVLPLLYRFMHQPVRNLAKELLTEHFRNISLRHSSVGDSGIVQGEVTRKLSFSASGQTSPAGVGHIAIPAPEITSARSAGVVGHASASTSPEPPTTPELTPRVNELAFAHPSLTKGMPFYNGYLYKLGDGILNRTWNLRYFLLIGPTLHYFLSPHEAKPRDVFNLKGAIVQWIKDQTRPFAFTVTFKDGQQRPLQLSGEDWKDTQEWIDRIQAAGKIVLENQDGRSHVASSRRRPSKALSLAADAPMHEDSLLTCAQTLQACVHASQISSPGFHLRELHNGLRIFERPHMSASVAQSSQLKDVAFEIGCWLALVVLFVSPACPFVFQQALISNISFLFLGVACLISVFWYVFLRNRLPNPVVVFACTRVDCPLEELRDILAEPSFYADWQPEHLQGRFLSLCRDKDEVLLLRFYLRCGFLNRKVQFQARRRWVRGENGARLLCAVAETNVEQKCASVEGCEGFAIIPVAGEENACMVLWLCGLHLATWAPHWLQKRLAVRRVSALAGLRDWVSCGRPQSSRTMMNVARDVATSKDSIGFSSFLHGFQCAASGSLYAAADLERAAVMTNLMCGLGAQMLRGGISLSTSAVAHGLLLQDGVDIAHCYAARWAYASTFLPAATTADHPRDRILQVVAFAVAGLHLAAASFPHFPWMPRPAGSGRCTTKLPDDVHIRIEPQPEPTASSGSHASYAKTRGSTFEARSQAGLGYRIHGTDEVACSVEFPGALRFSDRGVTTVDLSAGNIVRYMFPELRVRASSWSLGRGSIYEWLGPMHFVDIGGHFQCDLCFGGIRGESDSITGALRDGHGVMIGHIRGSWLGPLLCDNQVLWRGPRLQPPAS